MYCYSFKKYERNIAITFFIFEPKKDHGDELLYKAY
jgi:hypothetical protein